MKRLPIWKRPLGAQKILEVGGGHDPYEGVTHAVDKFPSDNAQRGGDYALPAGAKFFQGDLEQLPFSPGERFDFIYASHVFEHVTRPEQAASEINRVADRGYIETPSPLREQLACPIPFDEKNDFHTLFCWASRGELHVIRKSSATIGEFPESENGRIVKALFHIHRSEKIDLEPLLPRNAKTTKLFFKGGLKLKVHESFAAAAASGNCAYEASVSHLLKSLSFPFYLRSSRLQRLRGILQARAVL